MPPFDKAPQEPRNQWHEFDREYDMDDIRHAARERIFRDSSTPPYKIDISQDLQEYVAFQEIPHFGAHFYYAFSPSETINHWHKFNKMNIPRKYVRELERALKLEIEIAESPIKGRISGKSKDQVKKQRKVSGGLIKKPKLKPKWEGVVEEESEPETVAPKKGMISIPTDVPAKAIPPALQRRMIEAERKSLFSLYSKVFKLFIFPDVFRTRTSSFKARRTKKRSNSFENSSKKISAEVNDASSS